MPAIRTRLLISVATLAIAATPLIAGTAAASPKPTPHATRITFHQAPAFHGFVESLKKYCVSNRTITVYEVQRGKDKAITTERSKANGFWQAPVAADLTVGRAYYAVVHRKANSATICRADKSRVLRFRN